MTSSAAPVGGRHRDASAEARIEPHVEPRLAPWLAFIRAHAAVSRRLELALEAGQALSLADYDALLQLAMAEAGRLRMSELADRLVLTRSGVSRLVDRLVEDGYVERLACPTDARGAFACLTEAGQARLQAASPTYLDGVDAHFLAAIPEGDRDAFVRALEIIITTVSADERAERGC
ncbi:MAG: MarR family winged helix-turn-helix transcriptional regulator [Candidatus Limnocylindrales bacterium]